MNESTTVGEYLLARLRQLGVEHVFGVCGDFVLGFCNQVVESNVEWIGTCNELSAAYAADGYARIKGLGALVTTYAVGELSALNGVAGSFAESVPVVVITGSPTTEDQKKQPLLHHTLGDYTIPFKIFSKVTSAQAILDDPKRAPQEIDRVLSVCLTRHSPVYISLPADMCAAKCVAPDPNFQFVKEIEVDDQVLEECLGETLHMLENAKKPIIIGDVELIRKKLQDPFRCLIEKSGYPYTTVMMGKTVLDEDHPQYIGLYEGDRSRAYVKDRVEKADCVIYLGALLTDFNTGGFSADLNPKILITATHDKVIIRYHTYDKIPLETFMTRLSERIPKRDPKTLDIKQAIYGCVHKPSRYNENALEASAKHSMKKGEKITLHRFFDRVSDFLLPNSVVIAETGVSMFSLAETLLPPQTTFIGQIFYGSIGYTVGAALGAAIALKDTDHEVVLCIGDGSFQVTAPDLSTFIRHKLKPVIFLINNDGYTIERAITDRHPVFNDIQPWSYHLLPSVFAGQKSEAKGIDIYTEDQLDDALENYVNKNRKAGQISFLEVHFDRKDMPPTLTKAGEAMAKKNHIAQ